MQLSAFQTRIEAEEFLRKVQGAGYRPFLVESQIPGIKHREIACSEDFEVLEIVSPADFPTRVVEAPQAKAEAAE